MAATVAALASLLSWCAKWLGLNFQVAGMIFPPIINRFIYLGTSANYKSNWAIYLSWDFRQLIANLALVAK